MDHGVAAGVARRRSSALHCPSPIPAVVAACTVSPPKSVRHWSVKVVSANDCWPSVLLSAAALRCHSRQLTWRDDPLGTGPEHLVAAGVIGVVVRVDQQLDARGARSLSPARNIGAVWGYWLSMANAPASLTR